MLNGLLIGQYENADNGLDVVSLERDYLDGRQVDLICLTWNRGLEVPPDSWRGPSWSGRFGSGTETERKQNDIQRTFGGTGRQYTQTYPLGNPTDQRDYQPAAAGQYNDAFRSFAQDLVAMDMQDSILRLSPEHNQDWGPRSCRRDPSAYADAFAQCVRTMMAVPGADFTFLISPAGHSLHYLPASWPTASTYWPTGQPPPIVTPSTYNNTTLYSQQKSQYDSMTLEERKAVSEQGWNEQLKPELDMWRDFADSKGARMGLVEWGVHDENVPASWGDDPWFVDNIFEYAHQHDFVFQHYWNAWKNYPDPDIQTTSLIWPPVKDLPLTRDAWKRNVFADTGEVPPPEPPTTMLGDYTLPTHGQTGWVTVLNAAWDQAERDVSQLAGQYSATVSASYEKPNAGTDRAAAAAAYQSNLTTLEADLEALATASGVSVDASLPSPNFAAVGWDVDLNAAFGKAGQALQAIDAGTSTGGGGGGGGGGSGPSSNYVFVTEQELQTAKSRADAGTQPFKRAYDQLINDANSSLSVGLKAVTDDNNDHRFYIDLNGRHDYLAMRDMGRAAVRCALAYWFTGDDRYARKAVDILHHWCLDPSTYMVPTEDIQNAGVTIEQNVAFPQFTYAASFVRGHARWGNYSGTRPWDGGNSVDAESAFERWVSDRLDTFGPALPTYYQANNQWVWRMVDAGASWAYLGSDSGIDRLKALIENRDPWTAFDRNGDGVKESQTRPWTDYRNIDAQNGYFAAERNREDAFGYTNYNLLAFALCTTIVERWDGTDLWTYHAPTDNFSGSTLHKAFHWVAPYVENMSAWTWNASTEPTATRQNADEAAAAFELAYAHWGDFKGAIDNTDVVGGRPHPEQRVLGPVTLTHGAP